MFGSDDPNSINTIENEDHKIIWKAIPIWPSTNRYLGILQWLSSQWILHIQILIPMMSPKIATMRHLAQLENWTSCTWALPQCCPHPLTVKRYLPKTQYWDAYIVYWWHVIYFKHNTAQLYLMILPLRNYRWHAFASSQRNHIGFHLPHWDSLDNQYIVCSWKSNYHRIICIYPES